MTIYSKQHININVTIRANHTYWYNHIVNNIAYIDGQNLHMGTTTSDKPWHVNLFKFRIFLERRYKVTEAYYFLGYVQEINQEIYQEIQKAGFILVFRQHNTAMIGKKKGNVDSDIIFNSMKRLYKGPEFDKIVLVSGDGDYKILVDFLIFEKKFEKLLFPNRKFASSLYKSLGSEYFDYLEGIDTKKKIS
jgi:uncharacterized LabA/DUF88 family protein